MKSLDAVKVFENPIVTELSPLEVFYDAEDDHDSYYDLNKGIYSHTCLEVMFNDIHIEPIH